MIRNLRETFFSIESLLQTSLQAQAKWELEVSKIILSRRKKFLLLALFPALFLAGMNLAFADGIPSRIPILGGSKAYLPIFVTPSMFYGSTLIGLLAGLITGVIGAGGGYILTPALMSFGVKGIMAVGTDQFHLFAKGIIATTIHKKLGNVNLPWLSGLWWVLSLELPWVAESIAASIS